VFNAAGEEHPTMQQHLNGYSNYTFVHVNEEDEVNLIFKFEQF
jgi:hypothetical protein